MEQFVTIDLLGQPYTFKAETEVAKAQEAADLLAKEVSKVEAMQLSKSLNINKFAILILAALNIADENIELKNNRSDLLRNVSERLSKLIRALDVIVE